MNFILIFIVSLLSLSADARITNRVAEGEPAQLILPLSNAKMLQENLTKKLDILLAAQVTDEAWYTEVNNIMFELTTLDKNVSNAYVKKIFTKTTQTPS